MQNQPKCQKVLERQDLVAEVAENKTNRHFPLTRGMRQGIKEIKGNGIPVCNPEKHIFTLTKTKMK